MSKHLPRHIMVDAAAKFNGRWQDDDETFSAARRW